MLFAEIANTFLDLGFPIAVAVYLLVYQGRQIDRFRRELMELQIAVRIILAKLEATKEYNEAIDEFRKAREDKER